MSKQVHLVDAVSSSDSEDGIKCPENLQIPAYMTSIMRRQFLQQLLHSLPAKIQNRVTVLKNIQLEHLKLESEFFQEVYKLEKQYHEKYQPLFDMRKNIVSGENDPHTTRPHWNAEHCENDITKNKKDFSKIINEMKPVPEDAKGIPCFWLTIFRNTEILSEMVQDHDEPVLKKLIDIKIKYNDQHSYTLEFHFEKNEFFSDPVLTKQYFLKANVDDDFPFGFEGPEIYKCKGCTINWEKDKNLTVRTIRKKQKHKEHGQIRTIVRHVPNDSFFNFFNPPEAPEHKYDIDEESQEIFTTDFEIGHFLRARIVPRAILYFTGDIIDYDDEDEVDGEEEDEEDEEDVSDDKNTGDHKNKPDCQTQ